MIAIAISNQKGGVGKTTTCVNLAAEFGKMGYSTLAVDIDPQGNCTSGLGAVPATLETTLYDVLIGNAKIADAVIATKWENVSLLPSNIDLAGAELELASVLSRETQLRKHLSRLSGYDVALIDCPPSLGLLTINALVAADKLVIPIQCEYYALEGVGQLAHTVQLLRESLNPHIGIDGVLLTMFDGRTNLSNEVAEEVRKQFPTAVFETVIPRNIRLSEAPSFASPVAYYDANCAGALAYSSFAKEAAARWLGHGR